MSSEDSAANEGTPAARVEEAAENLEETATDAAEEVRDAVNDAADDVAETVEEASEDVNGEVEDAAETVARETGISEEMARSLIREELDARFGPPDTGGGGPVVTETTTTVVEPEPEPEVVEPDSPPTRPHWFFR